jgi:hypothetical protein
MTTTFHLPANSLDQSFLDRVKSMFRERSVAITISDDEEAMKAVLNAQRNISSEKVAAYRERVRALRGSAPGIDTTVERDDDRV